MEWPLTRGLLQNFTETRYLRTLTEGPLAGASLRLGSYHGLAQLVNNPRDPLARQGSELVAVPNEGDCLN